jgi:hypothetical protein
MCIEPALSSRLGGILVEIVMIDNNNADHNEISSTLLLCCTKVYCVEYRGERTVRCVCCVIPYDVWDTEGRVCCVVLYDVRRRKHVISVHAALMPQQLGCVPR